MRAEDGGRATRWYAGYVGRAIFDAEAGVWHGEVEGIRDVVTFESATREGVDAAFKDSVDDYLAMCAERREAANLPTTVGQRVAYECPRCHMYSSGDEGHSCTAPASPPSPAAAPAPDEPHRDGYWCANHRCNRCYGARTWQESAIDDATLRIAELEAQVRTLQKRIAERDAELLDAARRYDDSVQFLQTRCGTLQEENEAMREERDAYKMLTKGLEGLLAAYRLGSRTPEAALNRIEKARAKIAALSSKTETAE